MQHQVASESICTTGAELKLAVLPLIANRTNTPARATSPSLLKKAVRKPHSRANKGVIEGKANLD